MSYPHHILLVKSEESFSRAATESLKQAGYNPVFCDYAEQVISQIQLLPPAMVIFDYSLLGKDGLNLARDLRQLGYRFPILMLSSLETIEERIACLESGADDYLLKPVHDQYFERILQIYLKPQDDIDQQLNFGNLSLDLNSRRLLSEGEIIDLTIKEFELLKYLMSHPGEILTREQILENVWGDEFHGESNVIEVYIRYLRLKLEKQGNKRIIHTIRGIGYVLKD